MDNNLVKDKRNKIPNFILEGDKLKHQPTGKFVLVKDKSHLGLRRALNQLKAKITNT